MKDLPPERLNLGEGVRRKVNHLLYFPEQVNSVVALPEVTHDNTTIRHFV